MNDDLRNYYQDLDASLIWRRILHKDSSHWKTAITTMTTTTTTMMMMMMVMII